MAENQEQPLDLVKPLNELELELELDKEPKRELHTENCQPDAPHSLEATPIENPAKAVEKALVLKKLRLSVKHDTRTLGFKYQGGIILAADSPCTNDDAAASEQMKQFVEMDKYLVGAITGYPAELTYRYHVLLLEGRLYSIREGKRMPLLVTSSIMRNMMFSYRGMGLSMGMLIAGYDRDGPQLNYIDSEAWRFESNLLAIGSGESFAPGVLDTGYKWDLTDEEAYNLARRSIYHYIDANRTGNMRLYHITPTGWKLIPVNDQLARQEAEKQDGLARIEDGQMANISPIKYLNYL